MMEPSAGGAAVGVTPRNATPLPEAEAVGRGDGRPCQAGSGGWGYERRSARRRQLIGHRGRTHWKSFGSGGLTKPRFFWRTSRAPRARGRNASAKFRQQQICLTGKALSRRVLVLGPRGANSSRVHVLQHKKIAGKPNQENGSMVGSFMRAPQEKPSIGSTI